MAYGRGEDGRIEHCGGWGMILGDEGGGYSIARSALRAALLSVDGRAAETQLLPLALDVLGIDDFAVLVKYDLVCLLFPFLFLVLLPIVALLPFVLLLLFPLLVVVVLPIVVLFLLLFLPVSLTLFPLVAILRVVEARLEIKQLQILSEGRHRHHIRHSKFSCDT